MNNTKKKYIHKTHVLQFLTLYKKHLNSITHKTKNIIKKNMLFITKNVINNTIFDE